MMHGQSNTKFS